MEQKTVHHRFFTCVIILSVTLLQIFASERVWIERVEVLNHHRILKNPLQTQAAEFKIEEHVDIIHI